MTVPNLFTSRTAPATSTDSNSRATGNLSASPGTLAFEGVFARYLSQDALRLRTIESSNLNANGSNGTPQGTNEFNRSNIANPFSGIDSRIAPSNERRADGNSGSSMFASTYAQAQSVASWLKEAIKSSPNQQASATASNSGNPSNTTTSATSGPKPSRSQSETVKESKDPGKSKDSNPSDETSSTGASGETENSAIGISSSQSAKRTKPQDEKEASKQDEDTNALTYWLMLNPQALAAMTAYMEQNPDANLQQIKSALSPESIDATLEALGINQTAAEFYPLGNTGKSSDILMSELSELIERARMTLSSTELQSSELAKDKGNTVLDMTREFLSTQSPSSIDLAVRSKMFDAPDGTTGIAEFIKNNPLAQLRGAFGQLKEELGFEANSNRSFDGFDATLDFAPNSLSNGLFGLTQSALTQALGTLIPTNQLATAKESLQQLMQSVSLMAQRPDGTNVTTLNMQLAPHILGGASVNVFTDAQGQTHVQIAMQSTEAQKAVEMALDGLKEALTQAGLKLGQVKAIAEMPSEGFTDPNFGQQQGSGQDQSAKQRYNSEGTLFAYPTEQLGKNNLDNQTDRDGTLALTSSKRVSAPINGASIGFNQQV